MFRKVHERLFYDVSQADNVLPRRTVVEKFVASVNPQMCKALSPTKATIYKGRLAGIINK